MKTIRTLLMTAIFVLAAAFPLSAFAAPEENAAGQPLIRNFVVTETGNGIYRAEWDITNVTDTVYVRIYAGQTRDDFSGELAQSIESGTHGSVEIHMPDIESGYYIFYMSATASNGLAGYKYSDDHFFYDNESRPEKLSGIQFCKEKNDLYVLWDSGQPASVLLFDGSTGEKISVYGPETPPFVVTVPKGHKKIVAGVAADASGITGRFDPVSVSGLAASDAEIILPSEKVTGKTETEISIQAKDPYSLKIFNNHLPTESEQSAENRYKIGLEEGDNDLIVFLTDSKNRMRAAETVIRSDTIAPALEMTGQTDDVRTADEEITLKGYVDDDAVLKYLGEEVELAGNYFYLNKPLGFGKNQFTLTASDEAGNVTEKTITVERVFWSQKNILLILLAITVISVAAVEVVLLFYKSDSKRRPVFKKEKEEPDENQRQD